MVAPGADSVIVTVCVAEYVPAGGLKASDCGNSVLLVTTKLCVTGVAAAYVLLPGCVA